jgi:phospholipid/cholesterol/gamma-HCH transport system substrate-binding protein
VTGLRPTALKLAIFALVSVLLFVGLFRMMSNAVGGDSREWTARFTSVSGLRAGDDVRVAGVRVGRVDAIEVVDNREALVTFTLVKGQSLHRHSEMTLRYQNLLGQRYLAIDAPSQPGPALEPGTEIPLSATSEGFDLTALLNGFEPLFSVLEPAEVNQLATTMVQVLQGESGTVEQLLRHTSEATRFLADREEVFDQVLANLTPVLENLDERSTDVDATVVQLRRLMTGLSREKDTFTDTIDHLGALLGATSSLLTELRPPLRRDIVGLRRTFGVLARERALLGETVETLPVLLSGFARSMQYGAFLNVHLCNLGLEAGGQTAWVAGDGGPYSEGCR